MGKIFAIATIVLFSISASAWTQDEVRDCTGKFPSALTNNTELHFVCSSPETKDTRTEFIALQYIGPGFSYVFTCYTEWGAHYADQRNNMLNSVGLLPIVGDYILPQHTNYYEKLPGVTQDLLKTAECTNSKGEALAD